MENTTKRIARYSAFEKRKFPFVYLLIAFPVLQFIVFWVVVNFSSLTYAFLNEETGNFTFDHFGLVFEALKGPTDSNLDVSLLDTMLRSMFLWALDFFILFPIGVTTTYILYRRVWGHYVFRICYIIPSLMGAVLWTQLMVYLVQDNGAVTEIVRMLDFLPEELGDLENGLLGYELTAFPTIVCIKIVMGLVGNNAVLTGAFSRVPDEIYESAELDGAGFWRTYVSIAVPCVWSTIATLLTFSLCSFLTADYNVFLFTGGMGHNGTSTIGWLLYAKTLEVSRSDGVAYYGYPAALGVFLTCLTLPVVLIGRKLIDRIYADVEI